MADIFVGLGAAVVKAACKVWLKDHTFAADANAAVVDALQKKIVGLRERRAAGRLFEGLEDTVADQIQATLKHEFDGLSENERNAAVLAVSDTLDSARLVDRDIFAADLDPRFLEKHVRGERPRAARDLSHAARGLYDRLLPECCSYVVSLARGLPTFHSGAFAEILRRERQILDEIRELLARMPPPGLTNPDANFDTMYRRQVTTVLGYVEIFGITTYEITRRYPLTPAYIHLTARALPNDVRSHHPRGRQADAGWGGSIRVDDALAMGPRLFLRGIAGSGKTTLLQWIGVRSAQGDFSINLSDWNGTVPFFIPLRRYVGRELPAPQDFLQEIGRHIADEMPRGWVHRQLEGGRGLVLIDGIDELPLAERAPARRWLRSLIETFPDSRYIVTSRHGAVEEDWLTGEGFGVADLELMSWVDVRTFVERWHEAIGAEAADETTRARLPGFEERLMDALHTRHHLRSLAINPLLCALLCALNLDRHSQLPRDRIGLYEAALDMLLERRDHEREIPSDGTSLPRAEKALILENLAYWLIRNGQTDAPYERMVEQVRLQLASFHRIEQEPGEILRNLLVRSGLIRESVVGRIDFIHRTFQEYLAAKAAVAAEDIGALIANAHADQWLEVVIMAAGHAGHRQRDELLTGILDRADREPANRDALQLVTVACRDMSPQIAPELQRRIRQAAEKLLPGELTRPEVMAKLGPYALDLLADHLVPHSAEAVMTIRAAAMIGGKDALPIISYCAKFESPAVRGELISAWNRFDPDQFAGEVLAYSPNATDLSLRQAGQIRAVRHIPAIRSLRYVSPEGLGDLEFVRHLPNLESLTVRGDAGLTDLSPLRDHARLAFLWIEGVGQVDLSPLPTMRSLRRLDLDCDRIGDLSPLKSCGSLREVTLRRVRDFAVLKQFVSPVSLTWLVIRDTAGLRNLNGLPRVHGLRHLVVSECPLTDLAGAARWFKTLESLTVTGTRDSVNPRSLPHLPGVQAATLPIAQPDLAFVADGMPSLETLRLIGRTGWDLASLRRLRRLRKLILPAGVAFDLTPLSGTGVTVERLP